MRRTDLQTLWRVVFGTVILLAGGTVGFYYYEPGIKLTEAFYQTLLLLLSHFDHYGFKSQPSRILVVVLIVASYVLIAYLLKWAAEYMIGLTTSVKQRRMKAKIDKLKDHTIICGLGRVGHEVAKELHHEGVPFVAVDKDAAKIDEATMAGYKTLHLDSTDEDSLKQAGILKAKTLIACLGEDSANLFVTLAARAFNPDIFIVARVNRSQNEKKLKNAGADRVAHPYKIGGFHMANMAMRSNLIDYMDIVATNGKEGLKVEEMEVAKEAKIAGHTLSKMLMEGHEGATVIAISGHDGNTVVKPTGKEVIYPGDKLIVLGTKQDLEEAAQLLK